MYCFREMYLPDVGRIAFVSTMWLAVFLIPVDFYISELIALQVRIMISQFYSCFPTWSLPQISV